MSAAQQRNRGGGSPSEGLRLPSARRRRQGLLVGSAEHFRWLDGIVQALIVLNVLDALFTLAWVRAGLATEANPLLRRLVTDHPVLFVGVKLALVGLGSLVLWRRRRRPAAVVALFLAFLVYYAVLLYHLQYLSFLVRMAT